VVIAIRCRHLGDDFYRRRGKHKLVVVAPGVFANDTSGASGGALTPTLVTGPSHGTLVTGVTDGSFTYMRQRNFVGMTRLTYTVSDGQATSKVATITITVLAPGQLFADSFVRFEESRADHTVDCADRQLGHHQRSLMEKMQTAYGNAGNNIPTGPGLHGAGTKCNSPRQRIGRGLADD